MKLTIEKKPLLDVLSKAAQAAANKPLQPVLSMLGIGVQDGMVRVFGSDTESEYLGHVKAEEDDGNSGGVLVHAQQAAKVVRNLPDGPVMVQTTKTRIRFTGGSAKFDLPTLPVEDHPFVTHSADLETECSFRVSGADLRAALNQTSFCVAADDARYGLNGLRIEKATADGVVRLVATDGHRLALADVVTQGDGIDGEIPTRVLVSRDACAMLRRHLPEDETEVDVAFGSGKLSIVSGDDCYTFRMIDGEFPDYKLVLPGEPKSTARVEVDALKKAVNRARVALKSSPTIAAEFTAQAVKLTASSADNGDATDEIRAELEGDGLKLGLNSAYVLELLGAIPGPVVDVGLNGELSPVTFTDCTAPGSLWLVMPMRLD